MIGLKDHQFLLSYTHHVVDRSIKTICILESYLPWWTSLKNIYLHLYCLQMLLLKQLKMESFYRAMKRELYLLTIYHICTCIFLLETLKEPYIEESHKIAAFCYFFHSIVLKDQNRQA